MKHFVTWPFCLLLAAFFSESCGPKELPIPAEQQILFESSYINFAWGKQHNGFLIDKDGNIWVYKSPLDWNFPSANGQISSDNINGNLAKATLHSLKIPMDELHKYAFKIYTIDQKKLGARVNTANDAGAYTMNLSL